MKKKKRHISVQRHKRLDRKGRLQAAKHWIPTYNGKNLLKGYADHFGTNKLCAAYELEMLNYNIDEKYKEQLKQEELSKERIAHIRKQKGEKKKLDELFHDSNETFYYIAGYTSEGVPYGVTWEEMSMEPYEEESRNKKMDCG